MEYAQMDKAPSNVQEMPGQEDRMQNVSARPRAASRSGGSERSTYSSAAACDAIESSAAPGK